METNRAALDLIKHFEGMVKKWYRDPVGVWTIGYGHTDSAGHPRWRDDPGLTLTDRDAEIILQRDLEQYENAVRSSVHVPLNENQFGALVGFTYNLGPGNLRSSTLLKKLNAGDYAGAADEFPRWNKAGGKVLSGLVRRRAAERELFLKPVSARDPDSPVSAGWLGRILSALSDGRRVSA